MDLCQKKRIREGTALLEKRKMVWLSFATEHRLILSALLGDMTQEAANEVVKQTCDRINEENLPLFVTDVENIINKLY